MKFTLLSFLSGLLLFASANLYSQTATAPSAGSGTTGDPYQIANLENLHWISATSTEWNKHYVQTADIDASSTTEWFSGQGWDPIATNYSTYFSGSYDGGGYTISNLYINRTTEYTGLFAYVRNGVLSTAINLSNINLVNVDIQGYDKVGGLLGGGTELTMENVSVTGTVSGHNGIGGIFGYMQMSLNSSISNSFAVCEVSGSTWVGGFCGGVSADAGKTITIDNCYAIGDVSGISYVGGFLGICSATGTNIISNCYSISDVTRLSGSELGIGSFVGRNNGATIQNSYAVGDVFYSATTVTDKGFCGDVYDPLPGVYFNNFFDSETYNQETAIGATPANTADMNTACLFTGAGWDFLNEAANGSDDIWTINSLNNNSYPCFTYQDVEISSPGNALNFDGTNDYVSIPNHVAIDLINNYTIEVWIKPESFTSMAGIVSKHHFEGAIGYSLRLSSAAPYTGLEFDGMTTEDDILTAETWYHIAAVNDNGTRKLYINGVEQILTGTPHTIQSNADVISIGADFLSNAVYFDGEIDEIRIWNTVRTACDIHGYMNTELLGNESDLVLYMNLNHGFAGIENSLANICVDNDFTLAENLVDNSNNGILIDFALTGDVSNWISSGADLSGSAVFNDEAPEITSTHTDQLLGNGITCDVSLPDYTGGVVATDLCDASLDITQNPVSGTSISGLINMVTLTVTDDAGNTDEISFNVEVSDNTDPEITSTHIDQLIGDGINCDVNLPDYTVDVVATDNCDASLDITQNPVSGTSISGLINMVTLTATDDSGNTTELSFNAAVSDNTDPEITSISNINDVETNESCAGILPDYTTGVIATDNCDTSLEITQDPPVGSEIYGTAVEGYVHLITITVTDDAGNITEDSFGISLYDNTNPEITCPENQVRNLAEGETEYVVMGTEFDLISAVDNCSATTLQNDFNISSILADAVLPVGITSIEWIAEDESGNIANCSFDVNIILYTSISATINNEIGLFPNPSLGLINISCPEVPQSITITDMTGKMIMQTTDCSIETQIDLTDLAKGIYFAKINIHNEIHFMKFVIE